MRPRLPFTAPDSSLVALVDCDTFYASCERVCRPDLIGKPIVVLSNNDGCIVSRNREAKRLGIPIGEPEFKLRRMLVENHVAVFSSNYTLYGDLSHRIMEIIESICPKVEIYSIDECFVMMDRALAAHADDVAREIREKVLRWIGVPVSIGIAPTKVLAKIAISVAKKYPAYGGIFNLSKSQKLDKLLATIHVRDIWGVGRKGALKLRSIGVNNALQMRSMEQNAVRQLLTVTGLNILMELRGIPSISEEVPLSHNCIISSRSLGYKVTTLAPLEEAVAFHAARAAEKLRSKDLVTQIVCVRIQTAYYRDDLPRHDEMTSVRLTRPTFDTAVIIQAAHRGLYQIYKPGCYAYAKVMVMLMDLSDPGQGQNNMLDLMKNWREIDGRRMKLMRLMDQVNRLHGQGTLVFASQGKKTAEWHMKRRRLSPAWTTCLQELLKVCGEIGYYHFNENQEQE